MRTFVYLTTVLLLAGSLVRAQEKPAAAPAAAQPANPAAEKLWAEVLEASKPPAPDWEGAPTEEQQAAYRTLLAEKSGAAADKAREFYTKFPEHPKALEAQHREKQMLGRAVQFGDLARVEQLEKSPVLTPEEKFEAEMNQLNRRALAKQEEGMEAVLTEFEKGIRELMKKYPENPGSWQVLLLIADNHPNEEKRKALYEEVRASEKAPEELKEAALGAIKKMDAVGHPLEISFTALDGRKVDVQEMDGKVVLIDFWATWCGPCVQEMPNVKKVYDEYHSKGFEIVGISFDKQKAMLENFLKEHEIAWPQYFDGEGWGNKFGMQFNITAIPAMWLVDKKGILRDLNARPDLEQKVKELLAEK